MTNEPQDDGLNEDKPIDKAKHKFRMRHDWNNLIDDIIQDGQADGIFDNLKGKGKPLNLNKSVFGQELELAHGLMKENDLTPLWISNRNNINEKIKNLRKDIERVWTRHEREFRVIQDLTHRGSLTISWDDACLRWIGEIDDINKDISNYNLKRPIDNLEIMKLELERELKRIDAPRWLR
ncbi:MAG: DUF1992 domain-containing protein [Chloroflexi bacterium]|nr:DUF1992 domain-containing protein [Chloroflexota bacterium]